MLVIDLNADLGEGFPLDEALLDRVTSASISCGAHAGDDTAILTTLRMAKSRGVTVGAHPGFDDRKNFGRAEQPIGRDATAALVLEQLGHFAELANAAGVVVQFVKPHGALYNQAQRDPEIAYGLANAARLLEIPVLGLPDSEVGRAAQRLGARFIAEGFADRGYRDDGTLIPRGEPGASLHDPDAIAEQVARLVNSGRIQTLCIHGDDPGAVALADIVRDAIRRLGIAVRGFVA